MAQQVKFTCTYKIAKCLKYLEGNAISTLELMSTPELGGTVYFYLLSLAVLSLSVCKKEVHENVAVAWEETYSLSSQLPRLMWYDSMTEIQRIGRGSQNHRPKVTKCFASMLRPN